MTTVANRIEALLLAKNGGNQSELARYVGVAPQAVQKWIAGKTEPGRENLKKVARYLGVSESELKFGEIARKNLIISSYENEDEGDNIEIPQFDAGGGMGEGRLLLDGQPGLIKNWHVDHEWLRLNVKNHTGVDNLCIVTGFGPSMRPMFNPGDPLLVDRGVTTAELDAIYFFRIGKHGFIKMLQRIPKDGKMILRAKSKNPDYDPFDIDETMDFQVLGRVLTIWKSEQF
jgi:transcriptional regulator with XRE-family HTH domain